MRVNVERLTAKQVKMIADETRRQIAENLSELSKEIEATYLYALREYCGWGKRKLLDFHAVVTPLLDKLCEYYEMPTGESNWICSELSPQQLGIDVNEIGGNIKFDYKIKKNKERKVNGKT